MRVLIALDGSKASEVVLSEALARPWSPDTTFCLITVVDPFFFTKAPLLLDEARGGAKKFLKEAAQRFEQTGWDTTAEVVLGNPRHAISECAEEWRADLVLVGSQGLNSLARLALGSTMRSVLRRTKCSVEVVRPWKRENQTSANAKPRILVATDSSEFSTAALQSVVQREWPDGTEVKVISVPELAIWLGEFPYFGLQQVEHLNQTAMEGACAAVAQGKEILAKAGLKVSTDVIVEHDSPTKTILEEAKKWNADLIVLGSHGRRGLDRFAMGSVSESVATNAHCSVEVVRARPHHELHERKGEIYESQRNHDGHAVHVS